MDANVLAVTKNVTWRQVLVEVQVGLKVPSATW